MEQTLKANYRNEPGVWNIRTLRWEFVSADKQTHLMIDGTRFSAPTSREEFVSNEGSPPRTSLQVRVISGKGKDRKDLSNVTVDLCSADFIPSAVESICRVARLSTDSAEAKILTDELLSMMAPVQ